MPESHPEEIKKRLLFPLTLAISLLLLVFILAVLWLEKSNVDDTVVRKSETVMELYNAALNEDTAVMDASLGLLADDKALATAFSSGDRQRLLSLAQPIFQRLRRRHHITHFYFHTPDGHVFLRVHQPQRHGDLIGRETLRQARRSGHTAAGVELGPLGTFTLRVVMPWYRDKKLIGYLELGEEVDHIIQQLHQVLGVNLVVVFDKSYIDRDGWNQGMQMLGRRADWERYPGYVVADSTLTTLPRGVQQLLAGPANTTTTVRRGDHTLRARKAPLRDAAGRTVGQMAILVDVDRDLYRATGVMAIVLVVSLAIGWTLIGFFTRLAESTVQQLRRSRQRLLEAGKLHLDNQARHIAQLEAEREQLRNTTQALEESRNRLNNAQRLAHFGNWEWTLADNTLHWSEEVYRIFGVDQESFHPTYEAFIRMVHTQDRPLVEASLTQTLEHKSPYSIVHRILRPDGQLRTVHEQGEVCLDTAGNPLGMNGTVQDVTERYEAEAFAQRLRSILDNSSNEIYVLDAETLHILQNNLTVEKHTGHETQHLQKMTYLDIAPDLSRTRFDTLASALPKQGEALLETMHRRHDGSEYPVEARLYHSESESPPVYIVIALDVSERVSQRNALEWQALHDPLTGLPNRALMSERLGYEIGRAHRVREGVCLMVLDIHRLREINDTLGHHNGDKLIREMASRLEQALRESDTVARISGDEFGILLPNLDTDTLPRVLEKIRRSAEGRYTLDTLSLEVELNIGIALYPQHGEESATLLQHADVALRQSKETQSGYAIYDTRFDPFSVRRLTLMGQLRHAIENSQLELFYQPKIRLADGQVHDVEALLRWHHPEFGQVSPAEFIPLAEQTGFIRPLTRWVLDEAIHQSAKWRKRGIEIQVAVNLSARNLIEENLIEAVRECLQRYELPPQQLTLEITESAVMAEPERSLKILHQFAGMGIRLSIDDYGTGYSSLAYLRRLPAEELKIDQSFVTGMYDDEESAVIVRSTIDLAHNLGRSVTAEGVEDQDVWDLLVILGCDRIQGYYLSEPLPAEAFEHWLESFVLPRR